MSNQRLLDRIKTCAQSDSKKCLLQVCLCANSLESHIYGFYFTCGNVSKNGGIFCSRPLIRCKDKIKICSVGGLIAKYNFFKSDLMNVYCRSKSCAFEIATPMKMTNQLGTRYLLAFPMPAILSAPKGWKTASNSHFKVSKTKSELTSLFFVSHQINYYFRTLKLISSNLVNDSY